MKLVKIFLSSLICVVSALLCFSLAGCTHKNGEYFPDSPDYYIYTTYDNEVIASYSFEVSTPDMVPYEVKFTIAVYHDNTRIALQEETKIISPVKDNTKRVGGIYSFDCNTSIIQESKLSLEITDVSVKPKKQSEKYKSYAIGLGTAGGAVLIACTVLFTIFKVKEKKR